MSKCEHYTVDCDQEERTCDGCAYCKPIAKTDRTYCVKKDCATKEECDRHVDHYQFDNKKLYSYMAECEEYQG